MTWGWELRKLFFMHFVTSLNVIPCRFIVKYNVTSTIDNFWSDFIFDPSIRIHGIFPAVDMILTCIHTYIAVRWVDAWLPTINSKSRKNYFIFYVTRHRTLLWKELGQNYVSQWKLTTFYKQLNSILLQGILFRFLSSSVFYSWL